MSEKVFVIYTDGGASGNPGPAGIGVVIKEQGRTIFEFSRSIGDATNNVAEYKAAIAALEESIRLGATKVFLNTDSELMYFQLTGKYKIKNENLLLLVEQMRILSRKIRSVEIQCIPREQNCEADRLAKQAIEKVKLGSSQSCQSHERGDFAKNAQSRGDFAKNAQQVKVVASKPIFGEESPGSIG